MSPAVRAAFWLGVRKGIHAEASTRHVPKRKRRLRVKAHRTHSVAHSDHAPRAFTAAELDLRAERMEANR
jgi:hypothetical protein